MRISQVKSLTAEELGLLLYIVNVVAPPSLPKMEFQPNHLTWFRHDMLLFKIAQQESKLTDEGKKIFHGLMTKLNKTWIQESIDYENSIKPELIQSEFSFESN